MDHK